MKLFLPCPHCDPEALSEALWLLSRPASVRQSMDTKCLFICYEALNGSRGLVVDDEVLISIHETAMPNGALPAELATLMTDVMATGAIPADAGSVMQTKVAASVGKRIKAMSLLPDALTATLQTFDQMTAAGLLAQQTMP